MNLFLAVLTLWGGAALTAWVARLGRLWPAWTAGAMVLLALALLAPSLPVAWGGATLVQTIPWVPQAGLNLSLRLDGLGMLFALMVLGIGLLVILYARYYLSERDCLGRFYAFLLLFMGAMLGVVLAENLLLLVLCWELTSLSSFLLITYWRERDEARRGGRMALTITGLGGFALLGGVLLIGHMAGSLELSVVLGAGAAIRAHPLYTPALVLVLLGVFTKSAQFPFHFWLPHAMAAPTPVSAYLHSATLVKAGVFLLARLFPVLAGTPEWAWLVIGTGLTTLLVGAWFALYKHDLKGLLAYSTISHLGLITLLFGLATPLAAVAAVFHIINHATFKASLFMAAGIIDHECGTRDMRRINGLWRWMPWTGALAMVAAAAMAGVPLFNGFLSKEMFFAETATFLADHPDGWVLPLLVVAAGMLAVAYSVRFIHDVFFNGDPVDLPRTPHEPPLWMKVPVAVLVLVCLLVGMLPALTVADILRLAAEAVLQGPTPDYSLALWHGVNLPLVMSVAALLGGIALYAARLPLFRIADRWAGRLDARRWFEGLLGGLLAFAGQVTRLTASGRLQPMLLWLLLAAVGLGLAGYLGSGAPWRGPLVLTQVDGVSVAVTLGLLLVTLATLRLHRQRLSALILVGALGLGVALIFVKFSAPDLALTQLSVEVVTIVLLLLALYFLPQTSEPDGRVARRVADGTVAVVAGLAAGGLTLALLTRPFDSIAGYFIANSVPGGGGSNVVNVILVDFRGFDTLGEITVLALAGLGIHGLLKDLQLPGPGRDPAGRPWDPDPHPPIMAALTRLLLPLALLVAVFILLRGHNQPGGGFIAGLITAVALILQYLTNGVAWTAARMSDNMRPVIAAGLLLATGTGLASLAFGYPFLTSAFTHLHWPVVGDLELASAMAFDLGVYLVVVGTTLLILIQLGRLHGDSYGQPLTGEGG